MTLSLKKTSPEHLASQIIDFYNEYDLKISGKINNQTAFQLIEIIEKKFQTDAIRLSDGTRIWNLLRIFLYSNFQKLDQQSTQKKINKNSIQSVFSLLKESVRPLHIPEHPSVWGFSSSESRKLHDNTYYDIYLDPLYEVLEDKLAVFEWPETSGYRRAYDHPVFSRYYVPMHFPLWSKTFWDLLEHKLSGRRNFVLESEEILEEIISFISTTASVDRTRLTQDINDFVSVFVIIKHFLRNILKTSKPDAVLIRCGYGRFPMALSQACRELHIPSIEIQHGVITAYLPAYRRTTPTTNKDCIPEYLLAQGEIFAELVRHGHLFEEDKVVTVGYPYLQQTLNRNKTFCSDIKAISPFPRNILFTSQWICTSEIKEFVIKIAAQFQRDNLEIGILFKPHPYDKNDYSDMGDNDHVILIDKYDDTYKLIPSVDIHSTVYSTSGLEAIAFGIPNIFVDLFKMAPSAATSYIVSSPTQFVESVRTILAHYQDSVSETKAVADLFFTPSPEKQLKKFFTELGII